MDVRNLRFKLAGHLMSVSLWVLPASRTKDLLMDALDDWFAKSFLEMTGTAPPPGYSITKRYR